MAPHLVGCLLDVVAALAVFQGLVDGDLQWLPAAGLEEGLLLAVDDRAGQGVAGCAAELGCNGGRRGGKLGAGEVVSNADQWRGNAVQTTHP